MEKPLLSSGRSVLLSFLNVLLIGLCLLTIGCHEKVKVKPPPPKDIVQKKEAWEERTAKNLKQYLDFAQENSGKLNDSISVLHIRLLNSFYKQNNYNLVWSLRGSSKYIGTKLYEFVKDSKQYGLFPLDYGLDKLERVQQTVAADTNAKNDAALWARNDLFLTDAFISLAKDLKQGRLAYDSVTLRKDTVLPDSLYLSLLNEVITRNEVQQTLHQLEPKNAAYLDSRAWVLLRLGRNREAIADFDGALALRPAIPVALYGRGLAMTRLGEAAKGSDDLAAARKAEPDIERRLARIGLTADLPKP